MEPNATATAVRHVVWLASYPRSGNTFLRTILWHCFGLRSASVYPKDLGGNRALEAVIEGRHRFGTWPVGGRVPDRDAIAASDGHWVRKESSWKAELDGPALARFNAINRGVLEAYGYL